MGGGLVASDVQLVPHFDLPFRFSGTSIAVVDQDTTDDIANCVEAICRTPAGVRDDTPDFGLDDRTFMFQPLSAEDFAREISTQEPRAAILVKTRPDILDNLIANVQIEVRRRN